MKNLNHQHDLKKQVEMYFDHALDPESQDEFLQKVSTDPTYQQAFEHEQNVRNKIKEHIYRPVNSSQLIKAIKNQIRKD
jgi:hypothetical protein